jgi:hypothetical protein
MGVFEGCCHGKRRICLWRRREGFILGHFGGRRRNFYGLLVEFVVAVGEVGKRPSPLEYADH